MLAAVKQLYVAALALPWIRAVQQWQRRFLVHGELLAHESLRLRAGPRFGRGRYPNAPLFGLVPGLTFSAASTPGCCRPATFSAASARRCRRPAVCNQSQQTGHDASENNEKSCRSAHCAPSIATLNSMEAAATRSRRAFTRRLRRRDLSYGDAPRHPTMGTCWIGCPDRDCRNVRANRICARSPRDEKSPGVGRGSRSCATVDE